MATNIFFIFLYGFFATRRAVHAKSFFVVRVRKLYFDDTQRMDFVNTANMDVVVRGDMLKHGDTIEWNVNRNTQNTRNHDSIRRVSIKNVCTVHSIRNKLLRNLLRGGLFFEKEDVFTE